MTCAKQITTLFCIAVLFSIPACRNEGSEPTDVDDNIVCPMLYQGNSLAEALQFIELPEERMETSPSFVNKGGDFVDQDLEFVSFDTSQEGVKYHGRVVLHTKPLATDPGS